MGLLYIIMDQVMSKELREYLEPKLKEVSSDLKAKILLAYALEYIDDEAFKFITGCDLDKQENK